MNDTSFENCIKCAVCTTACPVSQVNPGYPGPKQAGSDGERLRLKDDALYDKVLKYCISCKHCEVACPPDVKISDTIQRARAKYGTTHPPLCNFVLSHTDLMDSVSTPFAPIVNTATLLKPVWQLLDAALKVDHRCTLPRYFFGTFRRWCHSIAAQRAQYKNRIAFFHGCFVNYNHPQLDRDLVKVLNAMGAGVQLLNKGKCCGVPLIANDFTDKTHKQAITGVELIREAVGVKGIPVIATSSTCTFALRDEYPEVLNVDNEGLHDHIKLATRWLWHKLDEGKTLPLKPLPLKMVCHAPYHMEKIGRAFCTLELLHKIPGPRLTALDSQYCGIAGIYGFKEENHPTLQVIGTPLFHQIGESGANLIITSCEVCKWQIEMSTNLRCEHPITLLAQALA